MAGSDESGIGLASTQLKILDAVHSAPSNPHARVGTILADKYRVERVLGEGGMGMVVAVTHLQLNQLFALKFLLPELAREPEVIARFMREAEAARRIKNEHIARVSDVGQLTNGPPFLVMEHLVGEDVAQRLATQGRLPIADAVDIVMQACDALVEAHAIGIIHRDLKPANLFLTSRADGSLLVKVLDFGISKALSETGDDASITKTHEAFGSPAYMSPEQIRSARNVDARSDIWALGVIVHELISGELPFEGTTAAALFAAVSADPPRRIRATRPEVSADLEATILSCLEKNRDARISSVAELAVAIAPFGTAKSGAIALRFAGTMPMGRSLPPIVAAPVSQSELARTGAPRPIVPIVAALVAIGVVCIGVAVVVGSRVRARPAVERTEIAAEATAPSSSVVAVVAVPAPRPPPMPPPAPAAVSAPSSKPRVATPRKPSRPAVPAPSAAVVDDPTSTSH